MNIEQTYRWFYKFRVLIIISIIACILLIPISIIFVKTPTIRVILPVSFAAILPALVSIYRKGKSVGDC